MNVNEKLWLNNNTSTTELEGWGFNPGPFTKKDNIDNMKIIFHEIITSFFQSEKCLLWDSIKADLENKIHVLEEDKHNVDFSTGLWEQNSGSGSGGNKSRRRKADPTDPDRRKKPVTVSGPYICYMLADQDILDDWTIIKKAVSARKKLKA